MEVLELEKGLKKYKDAEIDIEIITRKNEKLCEDNNVEIRKLEEVRDKIEIALESDLKKAKLKKLECKFGGYVGAIGFKEQPDQWIYVDEILMAWIISLPALFKNLYLKITTTVKKGDLKKQIMIDNKKWFKESKITDDGIGCTLCLENDETFQHKFYVEGITIKRQDPKFSITIKKKK